MVVAVLGVASADTKGTSDTGVLGADIDLFKSDVQSFLVYSETSSLLRLYRKSHSRSSPPVRM